MISRKELYFKLKEDGYLEGYNHIYSLTKDIRRRLRNDYDCVVAITGEPGSGKSTLAIMLGILTDQRYNINQNISMIPNSKTIKEEFTNLKRFSVFHVDEAVRALNKHKWHNTLQQTINELYDTERWRNICTFLLIPRFKTLNENFRNHRIAIWIHLYKRGVAHVFFKDFDKDIDEPWHMKDNMKIKQKFLKYKVSERNMYSILYAEKKTPCFGFEFKFPDYAKVDPEGYSLYENLKIKSREVVDEEESEGETLSDREKKYRIAIGKIVLHLRNKIGMKAKELEKIMGITQMTLKSYTKVVEKEKDVDNNDN